MFEKIFVSAQVKRIVIVSNKHGTYQSSHELPKELSLGPVEIRKHQENLKTS